MKYTIKLSVGIILGFFWYFLFSEIIPVKPDPGTFAVAYFTGLLIFIKRD